MHSVLYFHGFASSPRSSKIELLRPLLAPAIELHTPDLNAPSFRELDWNAMVERALEAARQQPPRALVGSSLGGLLALEVARRGIRVPLVLLAPALGVSDQWLGRIPAGDPIVVFNHATGSDAPIHRSFFSQMASVDADRQPPAERVVVLMGRHDESVPYERVESTWRNWEQTGALAPGSRFVEIPEGDHSLTTEVKLIAEEIRGAVAG